MRDRWYSDKRDLVKWASLLHLAKAQNLETILQVAFYRPDDNKHRLKTPNGTVDLPVAVLEHFRNLERIEGLAQSSNMHIEVFKRPFVVDGKASKAKRDFQVEYFKWLLAKIKTFQRRGLLVFLDPDTGIAPQRPGLKHVLPQEIRKVFEAIKPGDWLALYQHARRDRNWQKTTLAQFAAAISLSRGRVHPFSCQKLAADVVLFAVKKARR